MWQVQHLRTFVRLAAAPVFAVALAAACAIGQNGDAIDAAFGGPADAPVSHPGDPDAAVSHPPDASVSHPPDAMVATGPDASTAFPCSSGATCPGAMSIGQVSGDTGNAMLSTSGAQSAWYTVRVTEDDSSIFGLSLRVAAHLTSPASADFGVFVYLNPNSDVQECNTPTGTLSTSGSTKTVKAEWGESGTFSNGSDDSRTVSIEVRPLSGTCAPGQTWQLVVEGDWL
jgi:hypothetical protein